MFGFPDQRLDSTFHGFPDKRVGGRSFYGFPLKQDDYDFKCDANTANFAFSMTLKSTIGSRIVIDKGDGGTVVDIGTGVDKNISWTYSQPGKYNINFSGETESVKTIVCAGKRLISILQQKTVDKFPSIEWLDLSGQFLSGVLPSFNNLSYLNTLYLYTNQFTGTLPSFDALYNLINFHCYGNLLAGEIPSFSNSPLLQSLRIDSNGFSGSIPDFSSNTALTTFNCSVNKLVGNLPSFSTNTALVTFNVSGNLLTGTLPSFNDLVLLQTFNCSSNQFTGSLPSFNNCVALRSFNISTNQFSGAFPSMSACTLINDIRIFTNQFTGQLPSFNISIASGLIFLIRNNLFTTVDYDFRTITCTAFTAYLNNVDLSGTLYFPQNCVIGECPLSDNIGLTNLVWGNSYMNSNIYVFSCTNCNLNIPFPLGSTIISNGFNIGNNNMSQINVDASFTSLFANRNKYNNNNNKAGYAAGNNAAPSGTYQQPSGFTHDLTEVELDALTTSVKEKIWILVNCQVSSVDITKRYKWTITTN